MNFQGWTAIGGLALGWAFSAGALWQIAKDSKERIRILEKGTGIQGQAISKLEGGMETLTASVNGLRQDFQGLSKELLEIIKKGSH